MRLRCAGDSRAGARPSQVDSHMLARLWRDEGPSGTSHFSLHFHRNHPGPHRGCRLQGSGCQHIFRHLVGLGGVGPLTTDDCVAGHRFYCPRSQGFARVGGWRSRGLFPVPSPSKDLQSLPHGPPAICQPPSSLPPHCLTDQSTTRKYLDKQLSDYASNTERRGIGGLWVFGMVCVLVGYTILAEELRSISVLGAYSAGVVFSGVSGARVSWEHNTRNVLPWLLRLFFACTVGFTLPVRMWTWKDDALGGLFVGVVAIGGKILGGSIASLPFLGGVDWPLRIAQSLQVMPRSHSTPRCRHNLVCFYVQA